MTDTPVDLDWYYGAVLGLLGEHDEHATWDGDIESPTPIEDATKQLIAEIRASRAVEPGVLTAVQAAALTDAMRYPENGALHCRWCDRGVHEQHEGHCWYIGQTRRVDDAKSLVDSLHGAARAALPADLTAEVEQAHKDTGGVMPLVNWPPDAPPSLAVQLSQASLDKRELTAEVERLKARLHQHEGRYDTDGLLKDEAQAFSSDLLLRDLDALTQEAHPSCSGGLGFYEREILPAVERLEQFIKQAGQR